MFYEQSNSIHSNLLKLQFSTDFNFPVHLHGSYEIIAILQVAYDCGYDSLRSFNRNFRKIISATPSAYRDARTYHKTGV